MKETILYEKLGFCGVATYINSGNVIFSAENSNPSDLSSRIEKAISSHFGFEVPVIIRTPHELENILGSNPFLALGNPDESQLYVTFLSSMPDKGLVEKTLAFEYPPDTFIIRDREVFVNCPGGYGRTKLNNTFFEAKLKVVATTRNWNTIRQLHDLSKSIAI